jgi:hypothetical protein
MIKYLIIFSLLGFGIGKLLINQKAAIGLILVVAIGWGITSKPIWGLVTLGELMLGYAIALLLSRK